MVLEPAAEVRELDRPDRARNPAILVRVETLFARIHQHAVAVNVSGIVG